MIDETDDAQRRQYRKAFARDVKLRVDEIAKKYILPDENTYDFALMYVPAENVYYEIAIRPEDVDDDSISAYALQRRVVPVSPNSIFAYLQVVVLGLRGLRIEANARQIEEDLARLGGDLGKLRTPLATLGRISATRRSSSTTPSASWTASTPNSTRSDGKRSAV